MSGRSSLEDRCQSMAETSPGKTTAPASGCPGTRHGHGSRRLARALVAIAISLLLSPAAFAQATSNPALPVTASTFTEDLNDPENLLKQREQRSKQRKGLFQVDPFGGFREWTTKLSDDLYDKTDLRLGTAIHHAFQWVDPTITDTPGYGTATDFDIIGDWKLFKKGQPHEVKLFFNIEGRWDYGTTGPQTLGFASAGTSGGTANSFSAYTPTFLPFRQFYLQQGSKESKWGYRLGKVTVDGFLTSSRHINPNTTFLPNAGTGMFVNAPPDSGLGIIGQYTFTESWSSAALISDANADRQDLGDISAGDFYKAAELRWRKHKGVARDAGAKLTVWHTDGTKDGQPANANTGNSGYGYSVLYETALADNGRPWIVARYGRSFDGASIYDAQAGLHFLLYQPAGKLRFETDLLGAAINWVDSATPGARDEYNFEVFYRFPIFPKLDLTASYQHIKDPAVTREFDHVNAFSIRLVTDF